MEELELSSKIQDLIHRDSQGMLYIGANDLKRINLNENEKITLERLLKEKNIAVLDEIIEKERPKKVKDFTYGQITEQKLNSIDLPKIANIEYDKHNEKIKEDYEKLDKYLEDEFRTIFINTIKQNSKKTVF